MLFENDWNLFCKDTYPEYNKFLHCDKKELVASVNQASSGLMLILLANVQPKRLNSDTFGMKISWPKMMY